MMRLRVKELNSSLSVEQQGNCTRTQQKAIDGLAAEHIQNAFSTNTIE